MKEYLKKSWNLLLKSFKDFDIRVVFIVLYDLIFLSIFLLSFIMFGKYLQKKSLGVTLIPSEQLVDLPVNELAKISSQLEGLVTTMFVGFIITLLIVFIAMCIFKGMIWFKVARKQVNISHIKKFTLLNTAWFLLWIIPSILLFILLKKDIIAPLLLLIFFAFIHFTNILYVFFTDKQEIKSVIKKAFNTGIKKIHLFMLPYIILPVIFFIALQLYWLYSFMPDNIQAVLTLIILLAYFAWLRIYLYAIIKNIDKNY